jgi:ABC-2 type transport system permease protein
LTERSRAAAPGEITDLGAERLDSAEPKVGVTGFWLPMQTLWVRELVRFWRQKSRVMGVVASPLVFWLVIGLGSGRLQFYFPGTLALTVMFSAIFSTISIIEDRREGFLLSMLVSPAPRSSMVLGKMMGASTLAWIQGMIFLIFAPLAGMSLTAWNLLSVSGIVYLIAFTLTGLGFLIAWRMDSTQGFHAVMNLFLVPMWMLSGSLFSMNEAHGAIRWMMRLNPLTYSISMLRHLLSPGLNDGSPAFLTSLIVTCVFGALLLAACAVVAGQKGYSSSA